MAISKSNLIIALVEDIGVDIEDKWEASQETELRLNGRNSMILELAHELPDILSLDNESERERGEELRKYLQSKKRKCEERLIFQTGYSQALRSVIDCLDERRNKEVLKKSSPNVGKHPPKNRKGASRKGPSASSK